VRERESERVRERESEREREVEREREGESSERERVVKGRTFIRLQYKKEMIIMTMFVSVIQREAK
jgi:hypothetical protein